MQNAEGGDVSARSNDRYDGFGSIVLDIVSLIERASRQAQSRSSPPSNRLLVISKSPPTSWCWMTLRPAT